MDDHVEELWDLDKLNQLCPPLTFVDWSEEDVKNNARFATLEDVDNFTECYARARGFAYRESFTKDREASKKGPLIRQAYRRYVCTRAGRKRKSNVDSDQVRSERKDTRDDCKHLITVSWSIADNCYRVIGFHPHHNHILLTGKESRMLPSNSKLTESQKEVARELNGAGLVPGSIFRIIANAAGGHDYVGFKIRTLYNFMQLDNLDLLKDGDAASALTYLASKVRSGEEPNLYCKLSHLFWADSKSREDYHRYKELAVFDATYKTVHYEFPLVFIVGVNNHAQTCHFASCLMRDETTASYHWLLTTFMECMDITEPPPLVITDSDKAMIAAIRLVFLGSLHRLCAWHIMRNFKAYVLKEGFAGYKAFKQIFRDCMTKVKNEAEFEELWSSGIKEYHLEGNEWLNHMYQQRHLWVEHFFSPLFSAKQNTTQRVEGMNAFFKRYIKKKVKLYPFMLSHDAALAKLRENELEQDVVCKTSKPAMTRGLEPLRGLEESAGRMYTRNVFKKVQVELTMQGAYIATSLGVDQLNDTRYFVNRPGQVAPPRLVLWNASSQFAGCSCGEFLEMGIPCRHIITVLKYEAVHEFPPTMVRKRWTMDAWKVQLPASYKKNNGGGNVDFRLVPRMGSLDRMWARLRDIAVKTDAGYAEVTTTFGKLIDTCQGYARAAHTSAHESSANAGTATSGFSACSNIVRDPVRVRPKGSAPVNKRQQQPSETGNKNLCGKCRQPGHNKRKCQNEAPSTTAHAGNTAPPEGRRQETNANQGGRGDPYIYEANNFEYEADDPRRNWPFDSPQHFGGGESSRGNYHGHGQQDGETPGYSTPGYGNTDYVSSQQSTGYRPWNQWNK